MEELITPQPGFPLSAMIWYYLGAAAWLTAYMLVIYKIIKNKFVELPGIVVAANVSWEILGGFVIYPPLPFGGDVLLWAWRAGAIMDAYMLYSVLRYGDKQVQIPEAKRFFKPIVIIVFICTGVLTYFYYKANYDLPMMYNSGMLLNLVMSTLCILLFLRIKEYRFSRAIAWCKFLATSVFFQLYIMVVDPEAYFAIAIGVICFVLDLMYIVLTTKRSSQFKKEMTST